MVIYKRKKNTRQRGSKTHSHGSMKKRRGAGHRGGRGAAGSGKRADSKKPSTWNTKYFGKAGFKFHGKKDKIKTVNISFLEEHIQNLETKKLAQKDGDFYKIDLEKLGYNKLLGKGKLNQKFKIKVSYASKGAIQAIKESGGELVGLKKE